MFLFLQKLPLNFLVKSLPALFSHVLPPLHSFLWQGKQLWCQCSDLAGVWWHVLCDKCLFYEFSQASYHSLWGIIAASHKTVIENQKPNIFNKDLRVLSTSGAMDREDMRSQETNAWLLILPQAACGTLDKSLLSSQTLVVLLYSEEMRAVTAKVSIRSDMYWWEDKVGRGQKQFLSSRNMCLPFLTQMCFTNLNLLPFSPAPSLSRSKKSSAAHTSLGRMNMQYRCVEGAMLVSKEVQTDHFNVITLLISVIILYYNETTFRVKYKNL